MPMRRLSEQTQKTVNPVLMARNACERQAMMHGVHGASRHMNGVIYKMILRLTKVFSFTIERTQRVLHIAYNMIHI